MEKNPILHNVDIARALKDEDYRSSLSTEQQAALPTFADDELSDESLEGVAGGSVACTNTGSCAVD